MRRESLNFSIASLSPVKLLVVSWLAWLLIFLLVPFTYGEVEYTAPAIAVLLGLIFSFLAGFIFKRVLPVKKNMPVKNKIEGFLLDQTFNKKPVYLFFFLGAVGVSLKVYEHLWVGQIFSYSSFFEYKLSRMYNELNSGMLGVASAILYPFGLVVLILQIIFNLFTKRLEIFIIWFCGLYWLIEAILLSSMTSGVIVIVVVFISRIIAASLKGNKTHVSYWLVFFAGVFFVAYFSYLTFFRITPDTIGISLQSKAIEMDFVVNNVLAFSIVNFGHYIVHGVVEWFRLYAHTGLENYYWGAYEFYPLIKIFTAMGFEVPTFSTLAGVAHKTGIYTTFWGPFILDFGAFSFFVAFAAGLLSAFCFSSVKRGSYFGLLFYPIVALQIVVSPFINIFSGVVVYYLVAASAAISILKLVKK